MRILLLITSHYSEQSIIVQGSEIPSPNSSENTTVQNSENTEISGRHFQKSVSPGQPLTAPGLGRCADTAEEIFLRSPANDCNVQSWQISRQPRFEIQGKSAGSVSRRLAGGCVRRMIRWTPVSCLSLPGKAGADDANPHEEQEIASRIGTISQSKYGKTVLVMHSTSTQGK